jgi:hypothetical protein
MRAIDWIVDEFGAQPWKLWPRSLLEEWSKEIEIPEDALLRAVHVHTEPLEEEGVYQLPSEKRLLPALPCAVPPWPISLVQWRKKTLPSRWYDTKTKKWGMEVFEENAALIVCERTKDRRFVAAVFCFQAERLMNDPRDFVSRTPYIAGLLHFDELGRWDRSADAWLEVSNRGLEYNLRAWRSEDTEWNHFAEDDPLTQLLEAAGWEGIEAHEIGRGRKPKPSDEKIFDRLAAVELPRDSSLINPPYETLDQREGESADLMWHFAEPWFAFALCSCKNVQIREHVVPLKQRRRHANQKRVVVDKFYTLQIDPMRKILRDAVDSEAQGSLSRALHICRGHFKTFDESAPLFGKLAGSFWWQPHVRGESARGSVGKDYSVNSPADR